MEDPHWLRMSICVKQEVGSFQRRDKDFSGFAKLLVLRSHLNPEMSIVFFI